MKNIFDSVGGRKVMVYLTGMATIITLVSLSKINPGVFQICFLGLIALFTTGNIVEHWKK